MANFNVAFAVIFGCLTLSLVSAQAQRRLQSYHDYMKEFTLVEMAEQIQEAHPKIMDDFVATMKELIGEDSFVPQHDDVDLRSTITPACNYCSIAVSGLKFAAPSDILWANVSSILVDVCLTLTAQIGIRGDPLCDTLWTQLPHVQEVLKVSNQVSPDEVCEFLNLCLPPISLTTQQRHVNLQKMNSVKNPVKSAITSKNSFLKAQKYGRRKMRQNDQVPENSIKVVQITDVHVEPNYAVASSTDCGLPVCCDPQWGPGAAGFFGDYNCNIPRRTVEVFVEKVRSLDPDIVLFSGDIPPHSVWDETEESQKDCSRTLVDVLLQNLTGYNVYPNIGNHEAYPTNLYSIRNSVMSPLTRGFLAFYADLWQPLANFSAAETTTIQDGGYYSKLIADGLRIISFNSNYMYTFNWYNAINHKRLMGPGQPPGEYDRMRTFVENSLRNAATLGEKVILLGHHPPGGSDYIVRGSRWYRQLVLDYADTIVLQPTGHTHYDEFRMIYDDAGEPKSVVLVSPSMSSGGTRNPSMRVYYLHNETKELLDYDHYFMDLKKGSSQTKAAVNWTDMITLLYSAKEEYNLPDLTPASWEHLLKRFEADPDLVRIHRRHSQADAATGLDLCLERCQTNHICRMRHINYDEYQNCSIPLRDLSLPTFDWGFLQNISRPIVPPTTSPPLIGDANFLHVNNMGLKIVMAGIVAFLTETCLH